jgi:MoxR-like ATPase
VTEALALELQDVAERLKTVRQAVTEVVLGQKSMVDQMLIALLCGGHALLEGVPGTAKTLAVRTLAAALDCDSKRIQFTPDLMPSDIVGTNVFNLVRNEFELRRGPIFTDLLLADEINRAPAKTQSALLEGMSEAHATIDGVRHELSPIFTVFATQNPIEFEGTYPLPEAQQDRFLLKIRVDYPAERSELAILQAVDRGRQPDQAVLAEVKPVVDINQIVQMRNALPGVRVEPNVLEYMLRIVRATRANDQMVMGAGPRGGIYLLQSAKAVALLHGRDYVIPDDVVGMVAPVLGHRVVLSSEAEIEGVSREEIFKGILDKIEVPR